MSGNEIETFQKISDFIDSFDSTSLGSIIILAILVCVVLVSVFKSIYSTSVEELFMNSKEKNKNMFFQLLVILTILIFINFMLLNIALIFMEILLGAVSLVVYIVYQRKENGTRKYLEMIDELNTYYKQRSSFWYLISIICLIPSLVFLINSIENSIPLFNCAVITSVIEVSIICIIMPEYIMSEIILLIMRINSLFMEELKMILFYAVTIHKKVKHQNTLLLVMKIYKRKKYFI